VTPFESRPADLTNFDNDLMTFPELEILTAKCLPTVVNGEIVHRTVP